MLTSSRNKRWIICIFFFYLSLETFGYQVFKRLSMTNLAKRERCLEMSSETDYNEESNRVGLPYGNSSLSSRGRFNIISQNLLAEAQKLRSQAQELEALTNPLVSSNNSVQMRKESAETALPSIAPTISPVPVSVLTSRSLDSDRRDSILQKISGAVSKDPANVTTVSNLGVNESYASVRDYTANLSRVLKLPNAPLYTIQSLQQSGDIPSTKNLYDALGFPFFLRWFCTSAVVRPIVTFINGSSTDTSNLDKAVLMELLNIFDALAEDSVDPTSDLLDPACSLQRGTAKPITESLLDGDFFLDRVRQRAELLERIINKEPIQFDLVVPTEVEEDDDEMEENFIINLDEHSASDSLQTLSPVYLPELAEKISLDSLYEETNDIMTRLDDWRARRGSTLDFDKKDEEEMGKLLGDMRVLLDQHMTLLQTVRAYQNGSDAGSAALYFEKNREILDIELRALKSNATTFDDQTKVSYEQDVTDVAEKLSKIISTAYGVDAEELDTFAAAEIANFFDEDCRKNGPVLSREGAGRFQNEILNGIMSVTGVKVGLGCAVFDGFMKLNSSETFVSTIEERLSKNAMSEELDFFVMNNDRFANLEASITQIAMDSLLGSSTAVVAYPRSWNSTTAALSQNPSRKFLRVALFITSLASSAWFSAIAFRLFSPSGPLAAEVPYIPDDFFYLTIAPIFIQLVALLVEATAAYVRGIKGTTLILPSLAIPVLGGRVSYETMPKNRKDLFDTASIGVATAFILSMVAMLVGFQLSVEVPDAAAVEALPSISLSVLKLNNVVAQLTEYAFPGVFAQFASSPESTVHLHWLAIAGAISFVGNTFQLIPWDNSPGSKLSLAALGKEYSTYLFLLAGVVRFYFFIKFLFTMGFDSSNMVTNARLLNDLLIVSSLAADPTDTLLVKDSVSDVNEGRKILYLGFSVLLLFSLVSFTDLSNDFTAITTSVTTFVKSFISGGMTPLIATPGSIGNI